jgi:hypothetical protein
MGKVLKRRLFTSNMGKITERRKHRRFQAKDSAFVVSVPFGSSEKIGRVINVSRGGLLFRYVGGENKLNELCRLDIFVKGGSFYLENLLAKTISDVEIDHGTVWIFAPMRRCAVEFGELSDNQISLLESFIQNHIKR